MLPNLLRPRRDAALVSLPDGRLIILGGYDTSVALTWMDSVECLSLHAPQNGWRNTAPLPQPIVYSGAAYFHEVVIIAGGVDEHARALRTVYALKPPPLSILSQVVDKELAELGQWTKLSAELPCLTSVNAICRVGKELFIYGEFEFYHLRIFTHLSYFM